MDLIVFLVLMLLGYGFGQWAEKRHYRSIREREARLRRRILLVQSKYPPQVGGGHRSQLVTGSVVVSVDYFKRFLAGLRNLFGGRVKSYETLIDRARREAILRMQEQALGLGADQVINLKLETASIYKGRRKAIGSIEVLAYGTALVPPAAAGA
ncbi:MAG TPA: YbjQ family protein [Gammaproteobacteria bacterium]|nr:YbjQ family protein [Gammaproteobacteria bacterium]